MHTVSYESGPNPQLPPLLAGVFKLAVEFPLPNVPTPCGPFKKKASARNT